MFAYNLYGGVLVIAAEEYWPPLMGIDLPGGGFLVEVTAKAFEAAGFKTGIKYLPWKRALALTAEGEFVCLIGAYKNMEREKRFLFSDPLYYNEISFFQHKDSNITYKTLHDLEGYTIGYSSGTSHSNEFDTATYLNKETGSDTKMNIRKLIYKRVDLIIDGKNAVIQTLRNDFPNNVNDIKVVNPPLKKEPLHVIFPIKSDKSNNIRVKFNEGLKKIIENGEFDKICRKHGLENNLK
jgi:polar amino acid transport system substrate-binding protein